MQRANGLNGQCSNLAKQSAYRSTVLTYNIEVVAACLATPVIIVATLETALAQSTELSESIGTVKSTIGLIE